MTSHDILVKIYDVILWYYGILNEAISYNPLKCEACKVAIGKISKESNVQSNVTEQILAVSRTVCYEKLHIFDQECCDGLVNEQGPIWIDALWQHYLTPNFFCPAAKYCAPVYEKVDIDEVVKDILKDKPKYAPIVPKGKSTFKFLQMADLHTDPDYKVGANKNCQKMTCCRDGSGVPQSEEDKAQYWGTIGLCDIPPRTFNQFINYIKNYVQDKVDFALWSGDNQTHNNWQQSRIENVENTVVMTELMQKEMPDLQVYPIFGNHESFPVNIYEYYNGREDQFNKLFGTLWTKWLGEEASQMLKDKGFYETTLAQYKNLKLIVLNTQACYTMNFSLSQNPTDPGHMLQLLRQSLDAAEKNFNQPVYIMGHIPPNADCLNKWAKIYNALVERYSHLIRGIFYGHSHDDEYSMFYDSETGEPINASFIAPSLTTHTNKNPSFRIIEADSDTFQVVNIIQYRLDIEKYNKQNDHNAELIWDVAYDFVSEYKLSNMWDMRQLEGLRQRIGDDLDTYNKYVSNFNAGVYTPAPQINKKFSCRILSIPEEQAKCLGQRYIPNILDIVAGDWYQKISKKTDVNEENIEEVINNVEPKYQNLIISQLD